MPQERDVRPWVADAKRIQSEVAALPHGKRELGLQVLAEKLNINAQTIRRAVSALDFLTRLQVEHKQLALNLQSYPVAAIEHLARWHKRDQRAALRAAYGLVAGDINVKKLAEDEKNSRKGAFAGSGKSLEVDYRKSVKARVERIVQSGFGSALTLVERRIHRDPSSVPDFAFEDRTGKLTAAALIAGPYQDPSVYERRAFDWIARAAALLNVFKVVFLVLPDNADSKVFINWRTSLKFDDRRLIIQQFRS